MADFEQNCDFLPFFQFWLLYPQFFGKFYAQLIPINPLNPWMYSDSVLIGWERHMEPICCSQYFKPVL